MHFGWAAGLGLALWLGVVTAGAQPGAPSAREAERTALYEQGVELAEAGRWAEAVESFQRVVAIRSAPKARFTLGEAQEKSGRLASAKASYALALEEARAAADEAAAGAAGGALAAIERRVPRLVVRLGEKVAGARATVDGEQTQLGERPVELDPGEHRLVVSAPGRHSFEQLVRASEGRTTELSVHLEREGGAGVVAGRSGDAELAPAEAAGERGTSAESWGPPAGAWVLGATGVAASAVGLALYFTGQSAYDAAAALCSAGECAEPVHADDGNGARGRMIAGDVVMAAGIGALASAVLWWAAAAGQPAAPPAAEAALQPRFGIGASRAGLVVTLGGKL